MKPSPNNYDSINEPWNEWEATDKFYLKFQNEEAILSYYVDKIRA